MKVWRNTKFFLALLVFAVFALSLRMSKGLAQEEPPLRVKQPEEITFPAYVENEIIVKFKPEIPEERIERLNKEHGVTIFRTSKFKKFRTLKIPEGRGVYEMVEIYSRSPLVEYAEPNFIYCVLWYPNDLYYQYQWHFDDDHTKNPGGGTSNPYGGLNGGGIRMEEAWPITSGSSSIIVAVVDTGVAYEDYPVPSYEEGTIKSGVKNYKKAPDLVNTNFVAGYDYVHDDTHPNDNNAHGTHVAGTIAQTTNNTIGGAGIAYNTSIMPIKVLDQAGCGYLDDVADGINFATINGAKVINLSLGGPDSTTMKNAVINAYNSGVTVVAACGNSNISSCDYPAAYNAYVIAVGATRYDETRSYYSSYGPSLDLMAPGGDVTVDQNGDGYGDGVLQNTFTPYVDERPYCASPNDTKADPTDFGYWFYQGTSMSTPHVSAVSALILALQPAFTPDQVRNTLQTTAEDKGAAGRDNEYGWGIIDAYAALSSLAPPVSISLTDGLVEFGILALGATADTSGDVQTVLVETGPADLEVKSTVFADNGNTWTLGASNGPDQAVWEFSPDNSAWTIFEIADTLYPLASNVAQGGTEDVYFRLTMPTETLSSNQYGATVTIVATSP